MCSHTSQSTWSPSAARMPCHQSDLVPIGSRWYLQYLQTGTGHDHQHRIRSGAMMVCQSQNYSLYACKHFDKAIDQSSLANVVLLTPPHVHLHMYPSTPTDVDVQPQKCALSLACLDAISSTACQYRRAHMFDRQCQ